MSDIIARLHAVYSTHPIVMEAAAEIESVQSQIDEATVLIGQQEREVVRLRAALQEIAKDRAMKGGAAEIARAALEQKP